MVDNFEIIEKFMKFEEGTFYKFELLVRNTDTYSPFWTDSLSKSAKNMNIKAWYVDTKEYYEKVKNEMKVLTDLTEGRLYININKKSTLKVLRMSIDSFLDIHGSKDTPSIKGVQKVVSSNSSKDESSIHESRMYLFDVDTKSPFILKIVTDFLEYLHVKYFLIPSVKGYHIICSKSFSLKLWNSKVVEKPEYYDNCDVREQLSIVGASTFIIKAEAMKLLWEKVINNVTIKENALALIYCNQK